MTMNKISAMSVIVATTLLWPATGAAQQAAAGARQRPLKPSIAETSTMPAPQGFSVVLVLGEMQGNGAAEGVPAAARKALADMKDFLPYKGYRLLDTQWTLCCGRGWNSSIVSRLRGLEARDYELTLTASEIRPRLSVRFVLRDAVGTETASVESEKEVANAIEREVSALRVQLQAARAKAQSRFEVGVSGPADEDRDVAQLRNRLADMEIKLAQERQRRSGRSVTLSHNLRPLIDTSFAMDVGETVVVGTSRLPGGDKALIALLTAVPSAKATGR
jgi:hypothetical protein